MYSLKENIFNFFSRFEKKADPYKDSEGKGTNQRYHEMLAEDMDSELIPLIVDILDNTLVPDTLKDKYIPYIEDMLGFPVLDEDLNTRRLFIKNAIDIYSVKGTIASYRLVLGILGLYNVEVVTIEETYGFDSPVTFDDSVRRFDVSNCIACSNYELHLQTSKEITKEFIAIIMKSIKFVEPINAKMKYLVINGNYILVKLFVSENGDLIYEAVDFINEDFLLEKGDLFVQSNRNYTLNSGNLQLL